MCLRACVCVCSLRYPACNAHEPYCHLWTVRLYYIFPHYLLNGKIFGDKTKKLLNTKCVFWFYLQFVGNISKIKIAAKCYKYTQVFMQRTIYCQILMKAEFSRKILEKFPHVKFQENPSSGNRVVPRRQADMMKGAVRKFANAPKKTKLKPVNGSSCTCQ